LQFINSDIRTITPNEQLIRDSSAFYGNFFSAIIYDNVHDIPWLGQFEVHGTHGLGQERKLLGRFGFFC
jgi:hypothetical protein